MLIYIFFLHTFFFSLCIYFMLLYIYMYFVCHVLINYFDVCVSFTFECGSAFVCLCQSSPFCFLVLLFHSPSLSFSFFLFLLFSSPYSYFSFCFSPFVSLYCRIILSPFISLGASPLFFSLLFLPFFLLFVSFCTLVIMIHFLLLLFSPFVQKRRARTRESWNPNRTTPRRNPPLRPSVFRLTVLRHVTHNFCRIYTTFAQTTRYKCLLCCQRSVSSERGVDDQEGEARVQTNARSHNPCSNTCARSLNVVKEHMDTTKNTQTNRSKSQESKRTRKTQRASKPRGSESKTKERFPFLAFPLCLSFSGKGQKQTQRKTTTDKDRRERTQKEIRRHKRGWGAQRTPPSPHRSFSLGSDPLDSEKLWVPELWVPFPTQAGFLGPNYDITYKNLEYL